ncbi:MAG: hypothetical protein LDLANPLL_00394 [Turneriella sp.]|nr:hypothetical protein [Turneriella sp.]
MKKFGKIAVLSGILGMTTTLFAQSNELKFYERFKVDAGGFALTPQKEPAQIGGGGSIGYALKNIDVYARFFYLTADSGLNTVMVSNLLVDYRIPVLTNFFTVTPYLAAGVWSGKIKDSLTKMYGNVIGTMYFEAGLGGESFLTPEISFFARVGVAYALARTATDSLNSSGPTLTGGIRYSFGSRTTPAF